MGLSTNQLSVFCKESKIGTDYIYICFTHISIHIGICIQQIDVAGFLLNLPVLSNPSSTLDQSDSIFLPPWQQKLMTLGRKTSTIMPNRRENVC